MPSNSQKEPFFLHEPNMTVNDRVKKLFEHTEEANREANIQSDEIKRNEKNVAVSPLKIRSRAPSVTNSQLVTAEVHHTSDDAMSLSDDSDPVPDYDDQTTAPLGHSSSNTSDGEERKSGSRSGTRSVSSSEVCSTSTDEGFYHEAEDEGPDDERHPATPKSTTALKSIFEAQAANGQMVTKQCKKATPALSPGTSKTTDAPCDDKEQHGHTNNGQQQSKEQNKHSNPVENHVDENVENKLTNGETVRSDSAVNGKTASEKQPLCEQKSCPAEIIGGAKVRQGPKTLVDRQPSSEPIVATPSPPPPPPPPPPLGLSGGTVSPTKEKVEERNVFGTTTRRHQKESDYLKGKISPDKQHETIARTVSLQVNGNENLTTGNFRSGTPNGTLTRSPEPEANARQETNVESQTLKTKLVNGQKTVPFIPPQFIDLPETDGNIKPSEYLRKVASKTGTGLPIPKTGQKDLANGDVKKGNYDENGTNGIYGDKIDETNSASSSNGSETNGSETKSDSSSSPSTPTPGSSQSQNGGAPAQQGGFGITKEQLQNIQLKKTEKPNDTERNLLLQKNDLIAELKQSKDINGIRKLREEKTKQDEEFIKMTSAELAQMFSPDNFFDKVPEKDANGCIIPPWKRQMMAKKAAEKARKEALEQKQREAEERKRNAIPEWKRQLLQKKEPEMFRNGSSSTNELKRAGTMTNLSFQEYDPKPKDASERNGTSQDHNHDFLVIKEEDKPPNPWLHQLRKTNSIFW